MVCMRIPIGQLGNIRAGLPCFHRSVAGVTGVCLTKVNYFSGTHSQSLSMQETPAHKGDIGMTLGHQQSGSFTGAMAF